MTRKDFVLIAEAIREAIDNAEPGDGLNDGSLQGAEQCALNLADALARTNDRFDRERFLKACGVQQ